MSSEWPLVKLEEVTSVLGDGLHGTPKYDDEGEYYFINGNNLSNGKIVITNTTKKTSKEEYLKYKKNLNDRTILVSINGTLGNIALYNEEKVFLGKSACYLNVVNEVDKQYIKYVLSSDNFQKYINSLATGSTIKNVSLKLMRDFTFRLPPIATQTKTSKILGDLDDKIELNRRMNETLEAMARAIFKSWFVDFDPVRAKAEGRDTGLPEEIADLFPDSFEETELGEVPEGWEVWRAGDVGDIICGKTPSTKIVEYYGDDVPFITIPDMHGNVFSVNVQKKLSYAGAKSQVKKMLPSGTICVSCIATPGLVVITTEESQTNQQINSVVPHESDQTYYWFWVFRDLGDEIKASGSGGSVLTNLSTGRFSELRVQSSTAELRSAYHLYVGPIFKTILSNIKEMNTLAELRDTLLPRLISGELRVKEAEHLCRRV